MGKLRDKMEADLKLKGLSVNTQKTYLTCAAAFVKHYGRPPAAMGRAEVCDFLLHLIEQRKLRPSSYNVYAAALRFLYGYTLERPEEVAWIGQMKVRHRFPPILSVEEVEQLLAELGSLKLQAIVMAAYGAGLRISEVCKLRVEDIDSRRMVIHVRSGKGDRHTVLPKRLLEVLRSTGNKRDRKALSCFQGAPRVQRCRVRASTRRRRCIRRSPASFIPRKPLRAMRTLLAATPGDARGA